MNVSETAGMIAELDVEIVDAELDVEIVDTEMAEAGVEVLATLWAPPLIRQPSEGGARARAAPPHAACP